MEAGHVPLVCDERRLESRLSYSNGSFGIPPCLEKTIIRDGRQVGWCTVVVERAILYSTHESRQRCCGNKVQLHDERSKSQSSSRTLQNERRDPPVGVTPSEILYLSQDDRPGTFH